MTVVRPEDFGAVPWSDTAVAPVDCRPAFQAALDVAISLEGVLEVGPGRWVLSRAPAGSYNRFAALSAHDGPVHIRGAGKDRTVLILQGDAGAQTFNCLQFDPGAHTVLVEHLLIDTTGLYNTDAGEQTHAIVIGSGVYTSQNGTDQLPVRDVVIRDVAFAHRGSTPGERWGDAIRVGGNTEATPVINVRLVNLDFRGVGRSAIAMQRNVVDLLIQGCHFDADHIGGTAIDGEATGGGWDTGLVVANNLFVRTLPGGDNYACAVTSQRDFSIVGNVFRGRGISMVRSERGVVANNVIEADGMTTLAAIDVANLASGVVISGNVVIRRGSSAGSLLRVLPHSGVHADGVVIANNSLTSETDGAVIQLQGARDVVLTGNRIQGGGLSAGMGVYLDAGTRFMEAVSVTGNVFRGCPYAAVRLTSSAVSGNSFRAVTVTGNAAVLSGPGIRYDNQQVIPPGGVVTGSNNW